MSLPPEELDRFVLVFSDVLTMGQEGRVAGGYLLLKDEIARVTTLRVPWAEELAEVWCAALEQFQQRYPAPWYEDLRIR